MYPQTRPGFNPLKTNAGNQVIFLTADYLVCKFNQLQEEYMKDQCITWDNFSEAKVGDICYFYYKNLPSATGYAQQRILLRGVVHGRRKVNKYMVKFDENSKSDNTMINSLVIGDLRPIALKDNHKFNCNSLKTEYSVTQFHKHRFEEKERKLFDALEAECSASSKNKGFLEFIKYFEIPCAFEKTLHPRIPGTQQKDPLTFISRSNGLRYYEKHHLVQQHFAKNINNDGFKRLIAHENNLFNLCPYCHRKIHHATPDVVSEMVEELYRQAKPFLDEYRLAEYIENEDPLTWLKQLYNANNAEDERKKKNQGFNSLPKDRVD